MIYKVYMGRTKDRVKSWDAGLSGVLLSGALSIDEGWLFLSAETTTSLLVPISLSGITSAEVKAGFRRFRRFCLWLKMFLWLLGCARPTCSAYVTRRWRDSRSCMHVQGNRTPWTRTIGLRVSKFLLLKLESHNDTVEWIDLGPFNTATVWWGCWRTFPSEERLFGGFHLLSSWWW